MRYEYPAVIKYDDGVYYLNFPDLSGCFTDGSTLKEVLENGEDALKTMLSYYESIGKEPKSPSGINDIQLGVGEIVSLLRVETVV